MKKNLLFVPLCTWGHTKNIAHHYDEVAQLVPEYTTTLCVHHNFRHLFGDNYDHVITYTQDVPHLSPVGLVLLETLASYNPVVISEQYDCVFYDQYACFAKNIPATCRISYSPTSASSLRETFRGVIKFPQYRKQVYESLLYGKHLGITRSRTLLNHFTPSPIHIIYGLQQGGGIYRGPIAKTTPQQVFHNQSNLSRRHAYVSLGTIYDTRYDIYEHCITTLLAHNYTVTVQAGSCYNDLQRFASSECTIIQHGDQNKLLQQSDLFITHGGVNSIVESILYGVPTIVIPQAIDQFTHAMWVERYGVGIACSSSHKLDQILSSLSNKLPSRETFLNVYRRLVSRHDVSWRETIRQSIP